MQDNGTKYDGTRDHENGDGQHRANLAETAWLAGVFDGEGSIHAHLVSPRKEEWNCMSMRLDIKISNTSKLLMEKVQRIVEKITYRKHKIRLNQVYQSMGKLIYCIEVPNQRGIRMLLDAMLPFLTVKKAQAEAAIAFCVSRKLNRHYGSGFTPEELVLPTKLKQLKKDVFDYMLEGRQTKRATPTLLIGEGEAIVGAHSNVG